MSGPGKLPEHDFFIRLMNLKNTLRYLMGEEVVTHTEVGKDVLADDMTAY
jgi:myo-inositol-1-phosphate synthase